MVSVPSHEWLADIPDGWEPPDELRAPSANVESNLAIRMLSCDYLEHEVRVLLGRFIAEHSLFTIWFMREGKSSRRELKETLLLTEIPNEQTRIVYEAWRQFEDIGGMEAPDGALGERRRVAQAALAEALRAAIATLSGIRTEDGQVEGA